MANLYYLCIIHQYQGTDIKDMTHIEQEQKTVEQMIRIYCGIGKATGSCAPIARLCWTMHGSVWRIVLSARARPAAANARCIVTAPI